MTTPAVKKKIPSGRRTRHLTVQMIPRKWFAYKARCKPSGSSTRKRTTPSGDARLCVGAVRVGTDGTHLYLARRFKKRNPHIKYSSVPTGRGWHMAFKWEKLYDARTKKPFLVKNLPKNFPVLS